MKNTAIIPFVAMFFLIVGLSCVHGKSKNSNHPDFQSIAGSGRLELTRPEDYGGNSSDDAWLTFVSDLDIEGESGCQAIFLTSTTDALVLLAACDSEKIMLCPNAPEFCKNEYYGPTKVDGNVFEMRSSWAGYRHRIEIHADRFVYRVQEKNCLVSYPHDCLIKGFGWNDFLIFDFYRINKSIE